MDGQVRAERNRKQSVMESSTAKYLGFDFAQRNAKNGEINASEEYNSG